MKYIPNTNHSQKQSNNSRLQPRIIAVDGVISRRRQIQPAATSFFNVPKVPIKSPVAVVSPSWKLSFIGARLPVFVAGLILLMVFIGGMWTALNTSKTKADTQPEVLGAYTEQPNLITLPSGQPPLANAQAANSVSGLSNGAILNMTLSQLENYLNQVGESNRQSQAAQILTQRKALLKQYLLDKDSPLAEVADTIAGLKHWQMVLAISNSESSLGRHCAGNDNNCSGIGVEPGNPLWHTYPNKAEWAKDLDRLIDRRYQNWTLQQMNGTYNKPGSENWIMAAEQILSELKDRKID